MGEGQTEREREREVFYERGQGIEASVRKGLDPCVFGFAGTSWIGRVKETQREREDEG